MAPQRNCECDNDIEHVQAQILLEQARGQTWIMVFCGSMAGLMPVLLVILPYVAAWNGRTIPVTDNNIIMACLGGYALVLTAMFGAAQKGKLMKALEVVKGDANDNNAK